MNVQLIPETVLLFVVLIGQSCLTLATPGTVAHQAPPSTGFSRQEYGQPFPSPGDLPNSGMEPASPALAGGFSRSTEEAQYLTETFQKDLHGLQCVAGDAGHREHMCGTQQDSGPDSHSWLFLDTEPPEHTSMGPR